MGEKTQEELEKDINFDDYFKKIWKPFDKQNPYMSSKNVAKIFLWHGLNVAKDQILKEKKEVSKDGINQSTKV